MAIICVEVKPINDPLAIDKIEDKYDIDFSKSFKDFFKSNNGGIPKNNTIIANGDEYEIRCFLSFNYGEYNSIAQPLDSFFTETHGKIVPIAKDSGDNYYCLNIQNSKVYYWDKDDDMYYRLADSFDEFVGLFG